MSAKKSGARSDAESEQRIRSARQRQRDNRSAADVRLLEFVGVQVRQFRLASGLTIAELAVASGLDPAYLGEVERGRANISVTALARIGRQLGVAVADLVSEI